MFDLKELMPTCEEFMNDCAAAFEDELQEIYANMAEEEWEQMRKEK